MRVFCILISNQSESSKYIESIERETESDSKMIYDADSGYVRRKYDKKCIGLMILGSVSAIVSVLITMWLCVRLIEVD